MAGGGEGVGVEEAGNSGVVVAGLEVIELGLGVVDIAPIGEGVENAESVSECAVNGQEFALYKTRRPQGRKNLSLGVFNGGGENRP